VTIVVGLVATALAFLPLALQHPRQTLPEPVPGTSTIWAVPLSGGAPHLVARLKGQIDFPVPSSDGRSLLVLRPTMLGKAAVWSIPLDGRAPRRVASIPSFGPPSWSPDRKLLVSSVWTANVNTIAVTDLSGHGVRTITRLRGQGGTSFPSWGGRNLAFVRMSRPATGWRLDVELWRATGGRLWSMPLAYPNGSVTLAPDGRRMALLQVHRLQLLTRHSRHLLATDAAPGAPVWTPDGRSLVYFDLRQRLVVQNVASHVRRLLATGRVGAPTVSRDGRTVYVLGFGVNSAVSIPK
jgi:Tol biopolymer transport system component